jgi:hypothetical protein
MFGLEKLSKDAVDEAAVKLQPMVDKVQAAITEGVNFALENALDRIAGAKITITIELPLAKATKA